MFCCLERKEKKNNLLDSATNDTMNLTYKNYKCFLIQLSLVESGGLEKYRGRFY